MIFQNHGDLIDGNQHILKLILARITCCDQVIVKYIDKQSASQILFDKTPSEKGFRVKKTPIT